MLQSTGCRACRLQRSQLMGSMWAQQLEHTTLVALDMWDLSSATRDQTSIPCIDRQILNPWTTREVPLFVGVSFIHLISGCVGSLRGHGLFSSGEWGLFSSFGAQASHCGGFSCWGAWVLWHRGFSSFDTWAHSCGSRVLEQRLNSWSTQA